MGILPLVRRETVGDFECVCFRFWKRGWIFLGKKKKKEIMFSIRKVLRSLFALHGEFGPWERAPGEFNKVMFPEIDWPRVRFRRGRLPSYAGVFLFFSRESSTTNRK